MRLYPLLCFYTSENDPRSMFLEGYKGPSWHSASRVAEALLRLALAARTHRSQTKACVPETWWLYIFDDEWWMFAVMQTSGGMDQNGWMFWIVVVHFGFHQFSELTEPSHLSRLKFFTAKPPIPALLRYHEMVNHVNLPPSIYSLSTQKHLHGTRC